MKTKITHFIRAALLMLVMLTVVCFPSQPASAASLGEDAVVNPAAEQYVEQQILAGNAVDLALTFPDEAQRVISGDFLSRLITNLEKKEIAKISISHATIQGDVFVQHIDVPFDLTLSNCHLLKEVTFDDVGLQNFQIIYSVLDGQLSIADASVDGALRLTGSTMKAAVKIFGTEISGDLVGYGATFDAPQPDDGTFPNQFITVKARMAAFQKSVFTGGTYVSDSGFDQLDFQSALFKGDAAFVGTDVAKNERFDKATFTSTSYFQNFSTGSLYFYDTVFNEVSFSGVNVEKYAFFSQATFKKLASFTYFSAHYLEFSNAIFEDEAELTDTSVETSAYFDNVVFNKSVKFDDSSINKIISFEGATFSANASLKNVNIGQRGDFINTTFKGDVDLTYLNAPQLVQFIDTSFEKGLAFDSAMVRSPYFKNVTFNGQTTFDGMQVSGDFEITNSSYNYDKEPLSVYLMDVTGHAWFDQITAPAGIKADHSHFGNLEFNTKDNSNLASIDLTDTKVDAQLIIHNARITSMQAEGLSVSETTLLDKLDITQSLDLRNAEIGFLRVDRFTWPENPSAFNLRGMTFTDIDLGNQGLTEETWRGLLHLFNTSAYSPQAYEAFAQFLTDKGRPDWASEVELENKNRERDEVLTPFTPPWLWSWFLYIFSGYGHRPILAFIWSGLVIALGAFTFRRREDMLPVDQGDVKLTYNPILYSFALFLPYIDLGVAGKWEPNPERKWAHHYKHIHMILGWVLTPIALLTFGGILG